MATAREYFDRNTHLEAGVEWTVTVKDYPHDPPLKIPVKFAYDFEGGAKHIKLYVPECPLPDLVVCEVLLTHQADLWKVEEGFEVAGGFIGSDLRIPHTSLKFSGRVLLYTPNIIAPERWAAVQALLDTANMNLLVRDGQFIAARARLERPLAFISHDSRDKDRMVRNLAAKLSMLLCPVWYDEYSLVPGQSLRENIELGLKTCSKCVVVLSQNFFSNPGWGKREFDMIYTREVVEGHRVMIPVWLDVTRQQVYDYSPILADTVGIPVALAEGGVVTEQAIETVATKVLVALRP